MSEEIGITYTIQIEKLLPRNNIPDKQKVFWDVYTSPPYRYSDKQLCLNDLKAYRSLSINKDEEIRAVKIEVSEIDE